MDQTTVFLGSFLLFQLELLTGKNLLPLFGGSHQVWNTCTFFFLTTLFLSQAMVDHFTRGKNGGLGRLFFPLLLALSLLGPLLFYSVLGKALTGENWNVPPFLILLIHLAVSIGPLFFLLSATTPLVQWRAGGASYQFYSYSNAGALLSLLSYPTIVEPLLSLEGQEYFWLALYGLFLALLAYSSFLRKPLALDPAKTSSAPPLPPVPPVSSFQKRQWILGSASTNALLLSVTQYLGMNLASLPLLWVFPLALFLLTLILNFKKRPFYSPLFLSVGIFLILGITFIRQLGVDLSPFLETFCTVLQHGLIIFFCGMIGHRNLFLLKPADPLRSSQYYSYMALGGILGNALVGLALPLLGRSNGLSTLDYFLSILLLMLFLFFRDLEKMRMKVKNFSWKIRALLLVPLVFLLGLALFPVFNDGQKAVLRNFYGIYRVVEERGLRLFFHGRTLHGAQWIQGPDQKKPLTYYHHDSPLGLALRPSPFPIQRVALVGLGAGSTLTYAETGQSWDVFELDPDVVDLSHRHFSFLQDAAVRPRMILGDARLSLKRVPDRIYDLMILDAFAGGSIPTHLLTREAGLLLMNKLRPSGLLLYHISNHVFDIKALLIALAEKEHWPYAYAGQGKAEATYRTGLSSSEWLALGHDSRVLEELGKRPGWVYQKTSLLSSTSSRVYWTDSYVNILGALRREKR